MRHVFNNDKFAVYSDVQDSTILGSKPIDVYAATKSKDLVVASNNITVANTQSPLHALGGRLDFLDWLPFAAKSYNISKDPADYILIPFIIMTSDLPNRNGVAFPLKELVKWAPEYGCQAFNTWKGKPTFLEHDNEDHTKAYGVIADVSMRKMEGFGNNQLWKVLHLYALDRTHDPKVTADVLSGKINAASMGAYVESYTCSVCGAEVGKCHHISKKERQPTFYETEGNLCFKNVHGIAGFELSLVSTPAYQICVSDKRMVI